MNHLSEISRRRIVILGGTSLLAACGAPRPPVDARSDPVVPGQDETLIALTLDIVTPGPRDFLMLSLYHAGPVSAPRPSPSLLPGNVQTVIQSPGSGAAMRSLGPLLFVVKQGWIWLGPVSLQGNQSAKLEVFARLEPNAINYLGHLTVHATPRSVTVSVANQAAGLERLNVTHPSTMARFRTVPRLMTRIDA